MADMKEEVAKIKKKYKPNSVLSAGTPIRMLGQYIANKQMKSKSKQEINKLIMQVDDFKLDGETRERKKYIRGLIARAKSKMYNEEIKRKEASKKENRT